MMTAGLAVLLQTNRQWMVSVTTLFLFLPLSLAPSVDWLRYISAFATLSMVYMIAIVTKNGITQLGSPDTTPPLSCAGGGEAECGNVPAVAVVSLRTTHMQSRRCAGAGLCSCRRCC